MIMWTSNEMSGGFMVVVLGGFDLLGVFCLLGGWGWGVGRWVCFLGVGFVLLFPLLTHPPHAPTLSLPAK